MSRNKTEIVEIIGELLTGGAERFVVDLSNELAKSRKVSLVVLKEVQKDWFLLNELNANVNFISLNKKQGLSFRTMIKLFILFRNKKRLIIHTHLTAIYYILPFVLFKRRFKIFHTLHNDAVMEAYSRLGVIFRKICFKTKSVIPITISDSSKASFERLYHFEPEMIYNGRLFHPFFIPESFKNEFNAFKATRDTIVLINIASVQTSKNQYMLAKCVDILLSQGYDLSLLIIGRWSDMQIVEKIKSLHNDRIFLLGEKSNPLYYLSLSDAFCLSSLYEGMPITLIESFACGIIPICTPVGGIKNVIQHKVNGFLSDSVSESSYFSTLKEFLNTERNIRKEIAGRSHALYGKFTMENCAGNYLKIFNRDENIID